MTIYLKQKQNWVAKANTKTLILEIKFYSILEMRMIKFLGPSYHMAKPLEKNLNNSLKNTIELIWQDLFTSSKV